MKSALNARFWTIGLIVVFLSPVPSEAQSITLAPLISTLAGNGTYGYSGDGGPAISAALKQPFGVAVDGTGNIYIADTNNNSIRKVDKGGTITTVAGGCTSGCTGDGGPATNATLSNPSGVAVDSAGNFYIADTSNQRIRKVDTTGTISTVAGNGTFGYSGDGGVATAAQLGGPTGVVVDSAGNLYIADQITSHIRKVNSGGTITTIAGGGSGCAGQTDSLGDGCPATSATLNGPYGVAADSMGNLYIADTGNQRIRIVNTGGVITTIAGNGTGLYAGDGGPATSAEISQPTGVAIDSAGNFYIADSGNQRIRKVDSTGTIRTVAGDGINGYSGDNGPAVSAELYAPQGVAVDSAGNLYIADHTNSRIREVAASGPVSFGQVNLGSSSTQTVFLSINTSLTLSSVQTSGDFSVQSDSCPLNTVLASGTICTLQVKFAASMPGQRWFPLVATASDPVQYSFGLEGTGVGSLLAFTPGIITTVAGNGTAGYTGDGGPAASAELNFAGGLTLDSIGNLYVADTQNERVRKVDTGGIITTVAGNGINGYSGDGGPALGAAFSNPEALAVDSAGNLYITDLNNNRIRKVTADGIISTVAGTGVAGYDGDGSLATGAELNLPYAVALDSAGNLYIADSSNNRIRRVDTKGVITTVAGDGAFGYSGDGGPATSASLHYPRGVTVDSAHNLYIADYGNNCIRKVDTTGTITTVAGNGINGYSGDEGPATSAELDNPFGLAVDSAGNLFIADTYNNRIRKVDTGGIITTVAGDGILGYSGDGGSATSSELSLPIAVALDNAGNLYIADTVDNRARKVDVTTSALNFGALNVNQTSAAQSVAVSNVGNAALNFTSIAASSNFQLQSVGNDCAVGTPLSIGATCELGAIFAPTTAGNPLTGSLTVSNDSFNSPQSVALSGIANSTGQAPGITSANNTTFQVGAAGSFSVIATGTPVPTMSETGALPNGVTFTSTGLLSGTPAANTGGTYAIIITASNGISPDATQNFTLTVNQAPAITSANSTILAVGASGSFTVTATGSPTPTLSDSGTLPSGVTFNTSSGVLSGTPAAGTGGTYNVTFTAQNGVSPNATQNFTLTVNQAPAITSANSTSFTVGTAGSFTVMTTGFPTATLSQTGTLPSGVTFNTSSGVLSGTPAAGTGGTYNITFTAQNGVNPNAMQTFTLTVKDFSISVSPTALTIPPGNKATFTITVTPTNGFTGVVTISCSSTLTGLVGSTCTTPSSVTLSGMGSMSATAAVIPPKKSPDGTYTVTFSGTSGGTVHSANASLTLK